eukprot:363312-Chlamydomonas_euryale.AAC.5
MGWDGMGWDGTGRDETGRDGTGWDGMGWDGMGWDGVIQDSMRRGREAGQGRGVEGRVRELSGGQRKGGERMDAVVIVKGDTCLCACL